MVLSPGKYIASELVAIGRELALVTVCRVAGSYVATWACSCGGNGGSAVRFGQPGEASEHGKKTYMSHCAAAHNRAAISRIA